MLITFSLREISWRREGHFLRVCQLFVTVSFIYLIILLYAHISVS